MGGADDGLVVPNRDEYTATEDGTGDTLIDVACTWHYCIRLSIGGAETYVTPDEARRLIGLLESAIHYVEVG